MRKLILFVATSVDGLIEGPHGEYDWCFTDQDYGMTPFLKNIDSIFYGRKSYQMMMGSGDGANPFTKKENYVFSTTLKESSAYDLINGDIKTEVLKIKQEEGKDTWLFGGADLTRSLMKEHLVDEIILAVHPIILGSGKMLFNLLPDRVKLKLIKSQSYETGLIVLNYEVIMP